MMNPFQSSDSKTTFWVGAAAGVMALCTIGFVALLVFMVRGGSFPKVLGGKTPPTVVTAPQGDSQPTPGAPIRPVSKDDHIRGDAKAPIVFVEYSDIECPFCKSFHETMRQLVAQNEGQVAWVYRHFPLDSLHKNARNEAIATECAAELGGEDKFWAYLDEIFKRTNSNDSLPQTELPVIAGDIGLNRSAFESCLASGRHADTVQADYDDAIAAGGTGTPFTVVVAGKQQIPVNGAVPFSQLQGIVDSLK